MLDHSDPEKSIQDWAKDGTTLFKSMYGDTGDGVRSLLDSIYPDMGKLTSPLPFNSTPIDAILIFPLVVGWLANTVGYGIVYGGADVLTQIESSFVIATANIAMGTPLQIGWHLSNAMNGGATLEEVQAVRKIAIEVSAKAGVTWEQEIPEITGL